MAPFPKARDTDGEDVIWALETAEALYQRSEFNDAVTWIRRAADAARSIEHAARADELRRAADAILASQDDEPELEVTIAGPVETAAEGVLQVMTGELSPAVQAEESNELPRFELDDDGDEPTAGAIEMLSVPPDEMESLPPEAGESEPPAPRKPPPPPRLPSAPRFPAASAKLPSSANIPAAAPPPRKSAGSAASVLPNRSSSTPDDHGVVPKRQSVSAPDGDKTLESGRPASMKVPASLRVSRIPLPFPPSASARNLDELGESDSDVIPHVKVPGEDDLSNQAVDETLEHGAPLTAATMSEAPARSAAITAPPTTARPEPRVTAPAPSIPPPPVGTVPPVDVLEGAPPFGAHVIHEEDTQTESSITILSSVPPPPEDELVGALDDESVTAVSPISESLSKKIERITEPPISEEAPSVVKMSSLRPSAPAPSKAPSSDGPASRETLSLEEVEAFADLPDKVRRTFSQAAKVVRLAKGEEVAAGAMAYVVEGEVFIAPSQSAIPGLVFQTGGIVRGEGTTPHQIPLRLIAASDSAKIAMWDHDGVEAGLAPCPWIHNDLKARGDRVLAVCGAILGPIGARIDFDLYTGLISRLQTRVFAEGEMVAEKGKAVDGLYLVGLGSLSLDRGQELRSGDFVFPETLLGGGVASDTVTAGFGGAVLLYANRAATQELIVTCPPLVEILAGM